MNAKDKLKRKNVLRSILKGFPATIALSVAMMDTGIKNIATTRNDVQLTFKDKARKIYACRLEKLEEQNTCLHPKLCCI
jgi:hypothetical protein